MASACGGPDVEQVDVCARLIPALEDGAVAIERQSAGHREVTLHYRATDPQGRESAHWISCRFAGHGLQQDRLRLTAVTTDREGDLSPIEVFMLRQYWLGRYEAQARASTEGEAAPPARGLLYFLQLCVHAATLGCIYGLLAIGYTLVYAVIGRINLAFGEIAMVGAYATFLGVAVLAVLDVTSLPLALLLVLLAAAACGAVHGLATERVVFRPLREARSQAPLIATIGLAMLLQEYLRLTQGAGERWVQPVLAEPHALARGDGFAVALSTAQIAILLLVACLYAALWLLMRQSRFGRAARACADDIDMAALCGVDVDRTIAATFVLGAAYAGIAGFVILLRYGGVGFYDGFLLGFKALTAAIVGGIGSVPGAMLGGLLLALWETLWAGYLTIAYKDVAVFGLLAAVLIWRPAGLLGKADAVPPPRRW
ncbi:MAG TPA: branched-chain amino acid ABC transporter permease LivH [Geminicoccaceae bacterium]|nr:branched-chain amino acid ABC transporter permease LivH [Geminicoccaceae bacterium]